MTKSKWRMLLSMFALFAVLAIAVACGDDDDDDDGGDEATPTTSAQAPSGTITIGATQFETWDPHLSDFAQDITHFVYVWRGLYHLDLQDLPQPAMAEAAPEISDDGKTYTITLKSDLKWSDGDDLTAEDFVWGILRTCNPETGGYYQSMLTNVVGCDEYYASGEASDAEKQTLMEGVGSSPSGWPSRSRSTSSIRRARPGLARSKTSTTAPSCLPPTPNSRKWFSNRIRTGPAPRLVWRRLSLSMWTTRLS
jgi:oligopeptide transport system substrate-binding protein